MSVHTERSCASSIIMTSKFDNIDDSKHYLNITPSVTNKICVSLLQHSEKRIRYPQALPIGFPSSFDTLLQRLRVANRLGYVIKI